MTSAHVCMPINVKCIMVNDSSLLLVMVEVQGCNSGAASCCDQKQWSITSHVSVSCQLALPWCDNELHHISRPMSPRATTAAVLYQIMYRLPCTNYYSLYYRMAAYAGHAINETRLYKQNVNRACLSINCSRQCHQPAQRNRMEVNHQLYHNVFRASTADS